MKKLHFFSRITLLLFVVLHLFNHVWVWFGVESHIKVMESLRVLYRNVYVESILLSAVGIQIYTAFRLLFKKDFKHGDFFQKLQVCSDLYLAVFFIIHVSAVLFGRCLQQIDTNIYFGAAGLNSFPELLFFIPYYFLAIVAFFGHLAAVHFVKTKTHFFGISIKNQASVIFIIGVCLSSLIIMGLVGSFNLNNIT